MELELDTEREWLIGRESLALPTKAAILSAVGVGELVAVLFDQPYHMPTYGFVNRQTPNQLRDLSDNPGTSAFSVPFLRPQAQAVLRQICAEAYEATRTSTVLPENTTDFRYAISSMTRTSNYQKVLVARGALAVDPEKDEAMSTHAYGLAFDIDHSGIYVGHNDGRWAGVGIGRQEEWYIPAAIDRLADVLEKFQNAGLIHAICEVPFGRGAYHVAVNPAA